jgi:transposase
VTASHVVSYVGLAPAINASADKQRLGTITKQGNALLRWVLGQAAPLAARADADLRRRYCSPRRRRRSHLETASPRQTFQCGRSRGDRWSVMTGSLNGTLTLGDQPL